MPNLSSPKRKFSYGVPPHMRRQEKQQGESTSESASRLGRFAGKMTEEDKEKKKQPSAVEKIQQFAAAENERKRKEEEEKKKKKAGEVSTAPEEGFLTRMYKKYVSGEK
jgi:endo-1,4-beta-D-glucanase Y